MLRVINPANGRLVASVPTDSAESIREKVRLARTAQPEWARMPFARRVDAVLHFRKRLVARCEELARTLTREMGKPITQSRNELRGVLGRIDFFIANAARIVEPSVVHADATLEERISQEPLGVVANISAWNYPYFVGANVFVPALLTGNAVIYKPSEFATLSGLEIGRMWHEAGVPAEVFAVVVGGGEVGALLTRHELDGVFFTGSYPTGRRIAAAVGKRMVKLQLELGGKDPVYVCDDVDVEKAAASIADGAFYNTGQSCCSVERIYVNRSIRTLFLEAFVTAVRGMKVGHPMRDDTYIGPLTRKPQLAVLARQVADARKKGARLLAGGARLKRKGNYFAPTVFGDVDHTMELMREESFGPIIGIQEVADDGEAVRLMRDTEYGLTAGVYSADRERAERILGQVRCGSAYWNCCDRVSPRLPWSGTGHSGVGLTLSTYGIETFLRPKAWHLRAP